MAGKKTTGFICPKWAEELWNRAECTIEPESEGSTYIVLDHSIQTPIYRGTQEECQEFLGTSFSNMTRADMAFFQQDVETFFDLMAEQQGPGAVVDFIEQTGFVTCPYCFERYWSEDGHPRGALCPRFDIGTETPPEQEEPGMVECKIHSGTKYWREDFCPECEKAADIGDVV